MFILTAGGSAILRELNLYGCVDVVSKMVEEACTIDELTSM